MASFHVSVKSPVPLQIELARDAAMPPYTERVRGTSWFVTNARVIGPCPSHRHAGSTGEWN